MHPIVTAVCIIPSHQLISSHVFSAFSPHLISSHLKSPLPFSALLSWSQLFSSLLMSPELFSDFHSSYQLFSARRSSCQLILCFLISSLLFSHLLSSSHVSSADLSSCQLVSPHHSSPQRTLKSYRVLAPKQATPTLSTEKI